MEVVYFVHDLSDAAIGRRVRMLVLGGGTVTPIGFRRAAEPVREVAGIRAVDLGQTEDGRLGARIAAVAAASARLRALEPAVHRAQAILARNLEMLALAVQARRRFAPEAAVIYECLDIHRLLLSSRIGGHFLRGIESRLWRDVDLLLTSSPAFVRNYFEPRGFRRAIRLVENKVLLADDDVVATGARPPAGPPWRIGWFGAIRCRQSLQILASLADAANGAIEIVIRGRPSGEFPDFTARLHGLPHVHFLGPYSPNDLAAIYGEVHFCWAIDYFESGRNSAWLLPNRIYEGPLHGAVPLALAEVETGHWLAEHAIGVCLSEPVEDELIRFFSRLDPQGYALLAAQVRTLPRAAVVASRSDCRSLVEAFGAL